MTHPRKPATPPIPAAAIAAGYDGAIVARRWLGAWIDFIVLACFLFVPDYVLGNARYQATIAVWLGLVVAYFPLLEAWSGRTVGKLLTGMRVVDAAGRRPSLLQALLRTVFRLLEVNPLLAGGIPAGIAVIASRGRQRIGDMVAGTYVLRDRDVRRYPAPVAPEPPPLPGLA